MTVVAYDPDCRGCMNMVEQLNHYEQEKNAAVLAERRRCAEVAKSQCLCLTEDEDRGECHCVACYAADAIEREGGPA